MIDFDPGEELTDLARRTAEFVREEVVPFESDLRWTEHGPTHDLRHDLVERARAHGLLSPHVATEYGGLGLSHLGRALVFEEAGWSMLGPVAMGIAAPDEGNAHLLERVGTEEQRERWLRPLAEGAIRTCFAMTEPPPGAGSDPSALSTTARRTNGGYVIDGRKWLITGADGAAVSIVMAREDDGSATMLLVPMDTPGVTLERNLNTMDSSFVGGHGVLRFDEVFVEHDSVLGAPGEGFQYAQIRLAPARLTHCMRWLGAARRAHHIALRYARERVAFGQPLAAHEGVGFMLADNEMDIRTCRLHIWQTAWMLDRDEKAPLESSIAKTVCAEAVWRVADRCVQILGGTGITSETIVQRIFLDVRAFRIYDGPSEVHRWSIAKRLVRSDAGSR